MKVKTLLLFSICGVIMISSALLIPSLARNTSETIIESSYSFTDEVNQIAKNNWNDFSEKDQETLKETKTKIDGFDCSVLIDVFKRNTEWDLRPYVGYKIIQKSCI